MSHNQIKENIYPNLMLPQISIDNFLFELNSKYCEFRIASASRRFFQHYNLRKAIQSFF